MSLLKKCSRQPGETIVAIIIRVFTNLMLIAFLHFLYIVILLLANATLWHIKE
jgi:hypothetical protein